MRGGLVAGLLLAMTLPAQADIFRYVGEDGRVYFGNIAPGTRPPPARRSQVSRSAPAEATRGALLRLIHDTARQHDLEPRLVETIVRVESNFDPQAVSSAGAQGLMQLMPATARRYEVSDPFNPHANVTGGVRYLKYLWRRFAGDLPLVLAAYHAGEHAVDRYGGIPPYPSTQRYVKHVLRLYGVGQSGGKIYRYRAANGSILFTNIPR